MAEGPKLLAEALSAGADIETVFVDVSAATGETPGLVGRAAATGADVVEVAPGVLERVADVVTPQGVVSMVAMTHVPLLRIEPDGLVLVCAGVADPGNAGTIVRSAAASGASAVVFCAGGVDVYNPKCVRATAGAIWAVPIVAAPNVVEALTSLASRRFRRLAAVARGGIDHDRVDWTAPVALVVGNEAHGLDAGVAGHSDGAVTVPMQPRSESLNVAMAATVICFEAARQRRQASVGAP